MRFDSTGDGVEESGGLSQPVEHHGARRGCRVGPTTPGFRSARGDDVPPPRRRVVTNRRPRRPQPTVPAPSASTARHVVTTRARTRRRSTPAWRLTPRPPCCPRGRMLGPATPGFRSARGHDVPPPRPRVVTDRRSRGTQPTVPEPSATRTRRVVTTRARTHPATVHPGLEARPTLATLPTRAHARPHHARLPVSARSRRAAAATPSGHEPSPALARADSSRAIGNPHAACHDHSRGTIPPPETRNGADPKADPVEECGGSPADSCQLLTLVVY